MRIEVILVGVVTVISGYDGNVVFLCVFQQGNVDNILFLDIMNRRSTPQVTYSELSLQWQYLMTENLFY